MLRKIESLITKEMLQNDPHGNIHCHLSVLHYRSWSFGRLFSSVFQKQEFCKCTLLKFCSLISFPVDQKVTSIDLKPNEEADVNITLGDGEDLEKQAEVITKGN